MYSLTYDDEQYCQFRFKSKFIHELQTVGKIRGKYLFICISDELCHVIVIIVLKAFLWQAVVWAKLSFLGKPEQPGSCNVIFIIVFMVCEHAYVKQYTHLLK